MVLAIVGLAVVVGLAPAPAGAGQGAPTPVERCTAAVPLVQYPQRWRVLCREHHETDGAYVGRAFPAGPSEPNPRIELYVAPDQSTTAIAGVLAHEMGHMRHTSAYPHSAAYLAARGLPAAMHWTVWTEDFAEAFARLYGPAEPWGVATPPPVGDQLERLRPLLAPTPRHGERLAAS